MSRGQLLQEVVDKSLFTVPEEKVEVLLEVCENMVQHFFLQLIGQLFNYSEIFQKVDFLAPNISKKVFDFFINVRRELFKRVGSVQLH